MTINRLLVISTPKNCFIHSKKLVEASGYTDQFVQNSPSGIRANLLAISSSRSNSVPPWSVCEVGKKAICPHKSRRMISRSIQDDKRMYDTCFNLFSYREISNAKFGVWLDPIIIIRKVAHRNLSSLFDNNSR